MVRCECFMSTVDTQQHRVFVDGNVAAPQTCQQHLLQLHGRFCSTSGAAEGHRWH